MGKLRRRKQLNYAEKAIDLDSGAALNLTKWRENRGGYRRITANAFLIPLTKDTVQIIAEQLFLLTLLVRSFSPVLLCRSRLATYLPLPVDETNGVAKWDARKETLAVTLPVVTDQW